MNEKELLKKKYYGRDLVENFYRLYVRYYNGKISSKEIDILKEMISGLCMFITDKFKKNNYDLVSYLGDVSIFEDWENDVIVYLLDIVINKKIDIDRSIGEVFKFISISIHNFLSRKLNEYLFIAYNFVQFPKETILSSVDIMEKVIDIEKLIEEIKLGIVQMIKIYSALRVKFEIDNVFDFVKKSRIRKFYTRELYEGIL